MISPVHVIQLFHRQKQITWQDIVEFLNVHGKPFLPSARLRDGEELDRLSDNSWTEVILATHHVTGALLGHVSLHVRQEWCGRSAYLSMLCVHPEYRREHIGRDLVKYAIGTRAPLRGIQTVECVVHPRNEASQRTVRSAGFVLDEGSNRWHAYRVPQPPP